MTKWCDNFAIISRGISALLPGYIYIVLIFV